MSVYGDVTEQCKHARLLAVSRFSPTDSVMLNGCSRELSQILHLNRKAEVQCILGSSSDADAGSSNHLDIVLDNIFGHDNPGEEAVASESQRRLRAAHGLVDYIVDRMCHTDD